ncbi:hypothetical protein EYB53_000855 [Candidatus Chloroploca sp. M-50]|uniref:Uncharacterized protein n=1 Tax=Candidatus Chloroploca mongolica TaxID=2528176 RepID=A0ABS4D477_9CHLR|nr:hypothetical protein [Candidatus Chloroploca mongolica]MBP1464245.1 hypothetical protein [Candidatus Chloroploca mongolica]
MGVGGFNTAGEWRSEDSDHFLHRWTATWGWATWRRAWQQFEHWRDPIRAMSLASRLSLRLSDPQHIDYRTRTFAVCATQDTMPWDIHWAVTCNHIGGLWISPSVNLITNLGFGETATHTRFQDDLRQYIKRGCAPQRPAYEANPGESKVDEQFDRSLFLMEVLNAYRNIRALSLWQRALERTPNLMIPGMPPYTRTLLSPLQRPTELLAILDYVTPFMTDNPRLHRLKADLAALVAHP